MYSTTTMGLHSESRDRKYRCVSRFSHGSQAASTQILTAASEWSTQTPGNFSLAVKFLRISRTDAISATGLAQPDASARPTRERNKARQFNKKTALVLCIVRVVAQGVSKNMAAGGTAGPGADSRARRHPSRQPARMQRPPPG